MGTPSTFSITNVTGSERMDLRLRGRALPYQPYTLEGNMRAEFTWYPGNAVATVQMLGAEEKTTSVNGMWKDRFIKNITDDNKSVIPTAVALFNDKQVADTAALCAVIERIRLAGQLVRVEWDTLVREGVLLRFRQSWKRIEDVEWEMEFQWVSRGEKQAPVTLPTTTSSDSFSKELRSLVDLLTTALNPPAFAVVADFTDQLNSHISEIEGAVAQVEGAVQNSVDQISSPAETAERALAATQTISGQASAIVTLVESFPPLFVISTATRQALGFEDALSADSYTRGIKAQARALQLTASEQANTLRAQTRQEQLVASFVARGPMDLRDVSQRFYETPDQWRTLLQYNNLASSKIAAGTLILVPKVNASDRTV